MTQDINLLFNTSFIYPTECTTYAFKDVIISRCMVKLRKLHFNIGKAFK